MAHERQPQRLNAMIDMHAIRHRAGAQVVGDGRHVGIFALVRLVRLVVARLEPGVLADAVEAVQLVEHFKEGGVAPVGVAPQVGRFCAVEKRELGFGDGDSVFC